MNFSDFHIAHLSSSHYPDDLRIFAKELNSLAQAGFRTTFVVQAPEKFRQPIHRANKKENIVIFNLKTGADRFSRLLRIAEIWKSLKEIKPDLVHLHDPELLLIVPLIKLQCHIPIIFDDHENISKDILTNYSIPKFLRATIAKIVFRFQLFVFHWLDGLVLVSEAFRNDYGNFPAKSMAIVRNFPISKNNDSQSPKPVPGRLIFIGRSTPVRGIEEMINALKFVNCQQASLVIIGPVDASYHEHLNKIIYSNKLHDRIKIIATTDQNTIGLELKKAEIGLVLIYPALKYQNILPPTKAFTYMMNRLPLVASNIPKWVEFISENRCGLTVNPYRPEEVADAIDRLLQNEELRREFGTNGYKAVQERYNWQSEFGELLNLYKKVLRI